MRPTILISFVIFLFTFNPHNLFSQSKTLKNAKHFKWDEEMCSFDALYDSTKYTETALRNTLNLYRSVSNLGEDVSFFNLKDVKKPNIDTLNKQYEEALKNLTDNTIIQMPFWIELKKQKIMELNEEYELKKTTIGYYDNPSSLLKSKYFNSCSVYATALASNDTAIIFSARRQLLEEQCKQNGYPEKLRMKFRNEYSSPQRIEYAKMHLMTFGWWNCANDQILHINQTKEMSDEFDKLFIKIEQECEED